MSHLSYTRAKEVLWEYAKEGHALALSLGVQHVTTHQVFLFARSKLRLGPESPLADQQTLLDAWQDLFTEGKLGHGWNLSFCGYEYFHVKDMRDHPPKPTGV